MAIRSSRRSIDEFLALKRIAVVGVSRHEKDFSRSLYRTLRQRGYDLVPINPNAQEVEGDRCYARLQEVSPPVEGALLMTAPKLSERAVMDCAEAGVRKIWMYRATGAGAVSEQAVSFCRSRQMDVVAGECPFMFLPGAGLIHAVHRTVKKLVGTFPA